MNDWKVVPVTGQVEVNGQALQEPTPEPEEEPDTDMMRLNDELETKVQKVLARPEQPSEVVAINNFANIQITVSTIRCLQAGEWLNDEVINYFLALLQQRELRKRPGEPRFHFFSTFFYNALFARNKNFNYQAVQRWTTVEKLNYSLIKCRKVFVPVHQQGSHWVLAVINLVDEQVEYYDSMGGVDRTCMSNLKSYIAEEFNDKGGEPLDTARWPAVAPSDIPQQDNGFDCGVFMLTYADYLSREHAFTFSQEHIPHIRERIRNEILQDKAD
ncbi:hypothetical protein CYMTET_9029 [Cymbomonas tetramitiformis]|uniref:Ubiquitin-like protease family profile domain-containing protein n=1 Tax=Cymbomonas tetramitiformis TaxID=36881 RepID=A0AAE0GTM4_9CHLO|nr:hypothetical protein CYMTET_9029 [Cymbomonas tetramitiformis]